MNFELFVNALIIAAIRHTWMQDELIAAGIKLGDLPAKSLGKPIWLAYQSKLKTMGHESAAFEMTGDLDNLERFSDPMTAIPKSPEVLRDKYQRLFDAHQFEQLGSDLRAKPESGKELIRDFQLKEASAVKAQSLSELSILVGHHFVQAKEKKSSLAIKGFERLAEMIGGFNPERLGILLGGTGFGKTNAAVNIALAAAQTMSVGYVNMEMGYPDMVKRFAVICSRVSYFDYASGNFNPETVVDDLLKVGDNISLTSGRGLTFGQIASWARLSANKKPMGLLIVDYDQKVDLNLKYQLEEWKALQKVMESFEDLAKELGMYVLILAQVNRDGLISGSHRAQFPAHTVLAFYEHEIHGPIIEAKKNRHGKKSQALKVFYSEHNSVISEESIITLQPPAKQERHKLQPKEQNTWWNK